MLLSLGAASAEAPPQAADSIQVHIVVDQHGSVLPGATAILSSADAPGTRVETAGEEGVVSFAAVPDGRYELNVVAEGFADVRLVVEKRAGQPATVTVSLTPRFTAATETVSVATTGTIELGATRIATQIDPHELAALPVGGRSFTQAALVKPGVVPLTAGVMTHGGVRRAGQAFAVNGQRPESNNYLLDGVKIVNRIDGGVAFKVPTETIAEFDLQTHTPSAEYGGASGSISTVFTRAAAGRWSATAYGYARNEALAARNHFARSKETLRQNQLGATLSGSLLPGRLTAFAYYEGFRNRQGVTRGSTVPTPEERSGDFSSLPYALVDPLTGQPFPGNVIPSERISPLSRNLLQFYPLGNVSPSFHSATRDLEQRIDQGGLRLDWQPGVGDSLLVRYAYARLTQEVPFSILGADVPDFPVGDDIATHVLGASHTHVFGPREVNTLHVGLFRNDFLMEERLSGLTPRSVGFDFDPTLPAAAGMPTLIVSGYSSIGDPAIGPRDTLQTNLEIGDTLTLTRSGHTLTLGAELRHVAVDALQGHFANGSYQFASQSPTRSSFANFLLGTPTRFTQAGGDFVRNLRAWEVAGFVQDDWRVRPRLTVNAGLRYEVNTPFSEVNDKLNAFVPGRQSTVYPDAPPGVLFPGDEGIPRTIAPVYYKAFGPRIGVAWDPRGDGKASLRAAYGILYDALANGVGGPLRVTTQSVPWIKPRTLNGNVAFEKPFGADPDPFAAAFTLPSSLFTIETGMRPAYVQQWNLVAQRSAGSFVLEGRYIGSKGTRLPRFVEGNPALYAPGATAANADRRRIYSGVTADPKSPVLLGHVALVTNQTNSTYHAGQLSLSRRSAGGLSFTVTYTLARLLDYVSSLHLAGPVPILISGENDVAQNPFDLRAEHGPSLFDARHRVTATFSWELPFGRSGAGAWSAVARGWRISGVLLANSPTPFTVYDSANVSLQAPHPPLSGVYASRPDVVGDPNAGPHTEEQWLNRDAFRRLDAVAEAGQFGNAGRSIARGPAFANLDLVLARVFQLGGERSLQLRVEVVNATNRVNYGLPVNDLASPNFGRILEAGPARTVQLGLRLQL